MDKSFIIGIDSATINSAAAVLDERGYYVTSAAFTRPPNMEHDWLWMSNAVTTWVENYMEQGVLDLYYAAVEAAINGKALFNLEAGIGAILDRNPSLIWYGTLSAKTVDRVLIPEVIRVYKKFPGQGTTNKKARRVRRKQLMAEWVVDNLNVHLDTQDEIDACLIAELLRKVVMGELKL